MPPLHFAFLVLEEHPYGREMLQTLLEQDFQPAMIIQEVSAIAEEEREKFLTRIAGQPVPPTIKELVQGRDIAMRTVDNHNDRNCQELLTALAPDVLVLGGTRIIRREVLTIPSRGTINAHPGLLPWLRGSASVGWALYKDMKIGATVHFIDPGIDTGPILAQRELRVSRYDTYESLNARIARLSGQLTAEVLQRFTQGEVVGEPQDISVGETFRVIPDDLLAEGIARLCEGRYSHYVDEAETLQA